MVLPLHAARQATLGNYPGLTLTEARKELRKQKVSVDQGAEIALDAQLERKAKLESFEEVARAWYERGPKQNLDKPAIVLRRMELQILPVLGKFPIDCVVPRDIGELITKLGRKKPTVAKKALSDIQKIHKHVGKFELVQPGYNPAVHFDWSDAGGSPSSRDRVLTDAESSSC